MSSVNFILGDAISYNEMNRLQELALDETRKHLLFNRYIIKGILPSSTGHPLGFDLYEKDDKTFISRGAAITDDNRLMLLREDREITNLTQDTSITNEIYISYEVRNIESGILTISSSDSSIEGVGTEFEKVLRPSSPGVPIFIQLVNAIGDVSTNYGTYKVESVHSNTRAVLIPTTTPTSSNRQTQFLPDRTIPL